MNEKVVAPCGIDCFNCEIYETNVTDAYQERFSKMFNVPKEKISCKGCIGGSKCLFLELQGKTCKTLDCINEKGHQLCNECSEFPCANLMPIADGADRYPHNMKVYNLCRMKTVGVEAWCEEVAGIRHAYFNKKMVIGEGGSNHQENK